MKPHKNKFEGIKLEILNLKRICRFCLSDQNILLPIFGHHENDHLFGLPSHIKTITSVEMEEDDSLPSLMCHSCLFNLEASLDFKNQCEQADAALRAYIKEESLKTQNVTTKEEANEESTSGNIENTAKEESDSNSIIEEAKHESTFGYFENIQKEELTEKKDSACQAEFYEGDIINRNNLTLKEEELEFDPDEKNNTKNEDKEKGGNGQVNLQVEPENNLQMEENMNDMEENMFGSEPFSLDLCSVRLRSECKDAEVEDVVVYPSTHLAEEEQWSESGSEASDDFDHVEPVHVPVSSNHCPACNKGFVSMADLQRHQLIHKQEPPYPCDYCDQEFEEKTLLKAHWRSHARHRPHMCLTCGEAYTERAELLKHFAVHDQIKPYHCPGCGKAFAYRSDLRKHAIIHTGARPFKCPVCGKTFTRSTNLNKHARVHSGRRPYPCEHCDKMFSSRGDLVRHAVIHTGEKPYACLICSLAFNRKDKLSRHERVHMTDRPFVCTECPTSFHRKEELTKHCRFHHFKPDPEYFTSAVE